MTEDQSNAQAIIDVALTASDPKKLDPGAVYSVTEPNGGVRLIDLATDELAVYPSRKRGTVKVQSADAFVAYLKKHGQSYSEVYADRVGKRIVGVVNASMGTTGDGLDDYAGWGDHRVEFDVILTDAWKEWLKNDGTLMPQVAFAEFIEDHLSDISVPAAAEMLEIAQSIVATMSVNFESTRKLSTGEAQLEYRETHEAQAAKGTLEIPTTITLGLAPFEGAAAYALDARFRYRINQGNLHLAYKLVDPELKIKDAFDHIVNDITEQLGEDGGLVLDGVPADPVRPVSPRNR